MHVEILVTCYPPHKNTQSFAFLAFKFRNYYRNHWISMNQFNFELCMNK